MYWVRLYAFEGGLEKIFVYGYATQASGRIGNWRKGATRLPHRLGLYHYTRFMSEAELTAWCNQLAQERTVIETNEGAANLRIPGGLIARPEVFGAPMESGSHLYPRSLSNQLTRINGYWQISKFNLLQAMFPPSNWPEPAGMIKAAESVLKELRNDTGIDFLQNEAGRFGNFEITKYLHGAYQTTDGLSCHVEPTQNNAVVASLVVSIDYPLSGHEALAIGCRLYAGRSPGQETLVLDDVRPWTQGTASVRFTPNQPFGKFEVSIRRLSQPDLIAYQCQYIIGEVNVSMNIVAETRRLLRPWSAAMPANLRDRAAGIPDRDHIDLQVGHQTSWIQAEVEAFHLARLISPPIGRARFLPPGQESQIEAVEFLAGMMLESGVARCIIADPYFDSTGIGSLLVRLRRLPELVVLMSHARDAKKESWTVLSKIVSKLRGFFGIGTTTSVVPPQVFRELKETCQSYHEHLPARCRLINIGNGTYSEQQFHDRYLLIERSSDGLPSSQEVWMLSNSFSGAAKKFPLVICPLPPDAAAQVADYIARLQAGKVHGRESARMETIWEQQPQVGARLPEREYGPLALVKFEGWQLILQLLSPEEPDDHSRSLSAVRRNLLSSEQNGQSASWHVPEHNLRQAIAAMLAGTDAGLDAGRLTAIANWEYYGGPSAENYGFSNNQLATILAALEEQLQQVRDEGGGHTVLFQPLQEDWPFAECLNPAKMMFFQAPLDLLMRPAPTLRFLADAMWSVQPQALLSKIASFESDFLLKWLIVKSHELAPNQVMPLFQSPNGIFQAIGFWTLWESGRQLPNGGLSDLISISRQIGNAVASDELLLGLIFVRACFVNAGSEEIPGVGDLGNLWPAVGLNGERRARLCELISTGTRGHPLNFAEQLALHCPSAADKRSLETWCIDKLLQKLPLRGIPAGDAHFWSQADKPATTAAAKCILRVYGTASAQYYIDHILGRLDFGQAQEPLLYTRDLRRWSRLCDGLLWGLFLGARLAEVDRDPQRIDTRGQLLQPLLQQLLRFGPELWHNYHDFHGLLVECMAILLRWLDETDGTPALDQLAVGFIENAEIPRFWRLIAMIHSTKLLHSRGQQLPGISANLIIPHAFHRQDVHWINEISALLIQRGREFPDLENLLNQAKTSFDLARRGAHQ